MTIDAMHWVWTHSRARGNVRLVLLAVADKAPDATATVRMGTTEFRARLNAPKSTVVTAVDKALDSGELVMVAPAVGSRAATYQLPYAVGYTRPAPGSTGPESGPLSQSYRSGIQTPNAQQGSENRTPTETATGPESGPGGSENETPRGPESGPLHQTTPTRSGSQPEGEPNPAATTTIPDFALPLIHTISRAGYDTLRWGNIRPDEWLIIHALIKSHGPERLARYAIEQCQQRQISYGRYFLPGWRELPPTPAPDPDGVHRLPVRPVGPAPTPQAARRNAARDYLDQLSEQLAAGERQ
ncbi:hypothetical protein ABZ508_02740 [Streptomyces lavendulocolor]|uniref:DNA-binding protein n=1 Tax=Streptomyces lavendulocolor TaxID=67316 RepID=A0ABV2VYE7_9ACTN